MFERFKEWRRRYHEAAHGGITVRSVGGALYHTCVCGALLGKTVVDVNPKLYDKPRPEGDVVPFRRRA